MRPDIDQSEIESDGFSIFRQALSREIVNAIAAAVDRVADRKSAYGVRNLLERLPTLRDIMGTAPLRSLVEPILGRQAFPVRAILFDKIPEANWGVPWHQDLTIAVKKKIDIDGFGAWSIKAGVPHVQSPTDILRGMLTLRIHLDDANESNGALMVVPGSHLLGRLTSERIARLVEGSQIRLCKVQAGDILGMRSLLVHASKKGPAPARRRVVHVEYASSTLPHGLTWFEAAPGNA